MCRLHSVRAIALPEAAGRGLDLDGYAPAVPASQPSIACLRITPQ
jgi:hypothetical protein